MRIDSRARNAPAGSTSHTVLHEQRARQIAMEARITRERNERKRIEWQRTASNVGVHTRPEPYAGPKQFNVLHPSVAAQLAHGATLRGRPPVPFVVTRDEALFLPYGGFRVSWRGVEVGRQLSWPGYDECRRLREWRRHSATPEERRALADVP